MIKQLIAAALMAAALATSAVPAGAQVDLPKQTWDTTPPVTFGIPAPIPAPGSAGQAAATAPVVVELPKTQPTSFSIGQVFSDAVRPYVDAAVTTLVGALVTTVLGFFMQKLHFEMDEKARNAIQTSAQNLAQAIVNQGLARISGVKVDVKSEHLLAFANDLVERNKGSAARLGFTPERAAQLIQEKLANVPAIAQAQAKALAAPAAQTMDLGVAGTGGGAGGGPVIGAAGGPPYRAGGGGSGRGSALTILAALALATLAGGLARPAAAANVTPEQAQTIEHIKSGTPPTQLAVRPEDRTGPSDGAGGGSSVVGRVLAKPFQDLADLLSSDVDEAIRLSTAIPNLQDGNGQACWFAMRDFGKVFKEHPVPLTLKLAQDIEGMRLLIMAANRLCQTSACTQVFQDGASLATSISPVPLPVPSFSSVCGKIPAIAVVPAVTDDKK